MSSLKFTILENDSILPIDSLSYDPLYAITDCIEKILHSTVPNLASQTYFFKIESLVEALDDEDEPTDEDFDQGINYGLIRCRSFDEENNQQPEFIPDTILQKLLGKKIRIYPANVDDTVWGTVFIQLAAKASGLVPPVAEGAPPLE